MKGKIILGLLAGAIALTWFTSLPERVRYKMTVEVNTPSGVKSGSAVREIVTRKPLPIPMLGEDRGSVSVRGEAVAIDLPGGQVLFALLRGAEGSVDYAGRDMKAIIREHEDEAEGGVIELWPAMPQTIAPRIDNPLPLLVRFRDLADPKSVEPVDPGDLATSFGDGVRLKRISIEKTDEDVTSGIEARLAKMHVEPDHSLDKDFKPTTRPTLAQQLGYRHFSKGLK